MKKYAILFIIGLTALGYTSCEDKIDPPVTELELNRALTPTQLVARIRDLTAIELTWSVRQGVDHYVVEFSEDSLVFNTIIFTEEVTADQLPYRRTFSGETRYSARVKAVKNGTGDSNWTAVTIMTAQENIFLPVQPGDIQATTATLRWPENSDVTDLLINPGNIQRTLTTDEKAAGIATITGLTGSTEYNVLLRRDSKNRGSVTFTTLIDIGDATLVEPADNLSDVIAAAGNGDVLVLAPGDYTVFTGSITLNKSIAIKGLYPYDKPKLHVQFMIEAGAASVEVKDVDFSGDGTLNDLFRFNSASVTYTSLKILSSNVHDFTRSIIAGNVAATVQSVVIDDCIMTDINSSGGDFIDFRNTYLADLTITNSTFDNCTPTRDFVRMDAASGLSGTGLTSNVLIDHCTFYGAVNNTGSTRRLLYVRFNANTLTVKNSLIVQSTGFYANQTTTSQPVCANNNYFNAQRFYDIAFETVSNLKVDNSGTHTLLDPGFVNADAGNFTITNQTLKDNEVGDPRWRQ
ncbi:MAG: DUF4957 domain-containing protein [Cyclobacteriaceae bacterium]|nr:DUF4957 domain-containing protein [Cyclobacteriaceae bacterium]